MRKNSPLNHRPVCTIQPATIVFQFKIEICTFTNAKEASSHPTRPGSSSEQQPGRDRTQICRLWPWQNLQISIPMSISLRSLLKSPVCNTRASQASERPGSKSSSVYFSLHSCGPLSCVWNPYLGNLTKGRHSSSQKRRLIPLGR